MVLYLFLNVVKSFGNKLVKKLLLESYAKYPPFSFITLLLDDRQN